MITILRPYYENLLLYHPNGTLVILLVLFVFLLSMFIGGLFMVLRLYRSVGVVGKQISDNHFRGKISFERLVASMRVFFRMIDIMEQRVLKKIQEIVDRVAREVHVPDHERDD